MTQKTETLAAAISAEKKCLVDAMPDEVITTFAATSAAFKQGGFRPSNTGPIRQRLHVMAEGQPPEPLRRLLARHSLNYTLVSHLSESAISGLRHELAALFGEARLVLAMQLDERQALRDTANRWIETSPKFNTIEPTAAAARLYEALGTICDACGATGGDGAPATKEAWNDERGQLNATIRELRAQLRTLKGESERVRRFKEQCEQLTCERDTLQAKLKDTQNAVNAAQGQISALQKEIDNEAAQREKRLRAAVDAALAAEFGGWIAHGKTVEAATTASATDDLLQRAASALKRQAAIDRHSGNRSILTARLQALSQKLADINDALANAIVQAPELAAVAAEIEAEMARLRTLLAIEEPTSALEATLHARLHGADGNTLYAIHTLLERLQEFKAFDAQAVQRLTQAANRRQAALLASGAMPEGDAAEPVLALRRALTGRGHAILLIDGHNLLFALQGRYMPANGAAIPDRDKRTHLVADITRIVAPHPTCRAWIVFDGPTPGDANAAPNVRVSYSGGSGEHRADNVLLDNINFLRKASADIPIILTSNDNELCGKARRLGAMTIAATEIGALL